MMRTGMKAVGLGLALWWTSAIALEDGRKQCDRAVITQLEAEARALVETGGCTDVSQCRAAPVGAQACGGPRDYVVYCSAAPGENELLRALKRLEQREERFNRQCDVISICIFVAEPQIELVDGECRAVTPAPETLP